MNAVLMASSNFSGGREGRDDSPNQHRRRSLRH
jgi:hypothetical protein